eukprot:Skav219483  [mRNA]  locus=scaffold2719:212686:213665:+ [translate_table: standard]
MAMWCRVPAVLPRHWVRQLTTAAKKKILKPEQIHPAASSLFSQGQTHFIGQCLYSITALGVADVVGDETLSVKKICERLGGSAREESLQRCLRLLAQNGFFKESAGPNNTYQFSLTAEGALLQTNVPGQPSMACGIVHFLEPAMWKALVVMPLHGSWGGKAYLQAFGIPRRFVETFLGYVWSDCACSFKNQFNTYFCHGLLVKAKAGHTS